MTLQALFGIAALVVFWVILGSVQRNLGEAIAQGIIELVAAGETLRPEDVMRQIELVRAQEFLRLFLVAMVFVVIFGYIISDATLSPAREALRAQKRFISNLGHELRTPLSIMKTNLEVLLMRKEVGEDTRKTVTENIEEIDRASGIINNLLSLDIYLQPDHTEFRVIDLARVAAQSAKSFEGLAESKNITIHFEQHGVQNVLGNEVALEQVLDNLLRNAIAHTQSNGRIDVTVAPDHDFAILTVRDNGAGISRENLLRIFEPFYRSDVSRARRSPREGSGLGLAIVNEIVRLHHGKISIESAVGSGTRIIIQLPYCAPTPDTPPPFEPRDSDAASKDESVTIDHSQRKTE